MTDHPPRQRRRSSAAPRSTTSRRSSPSRRRSERGRSTSSRTTPTPSSRGTTRCARPQLRKLYEKAKTGQWNATHRPAVGHRGRRRDGRRRATRGPRHRPRPEPCTTAPPVEKWGDKEWLEFGIEGRNWTLSASSSTASRARCSAPPRSSRPCRGTTPSCTPRTQVVDEARHVEVFARYLEREARRRVPGQRPPADAARRHHQRQPLGHDLPRHAGDGRGPRPRRVRVHAPDDRRSRCSSSCCAT